MSRRTVQIGSHIQQLLSALFVRLVEFPPGVIVSVLNVTVSPDLHHAKASIVVHPREQRGTALHKIKQKLGEIQQELAPQLTMKFTPRLKVVLDPSQEKVDRINELLDSLKPNR